MAGVCIHHSADEHGAIEVVEQGGVRSLHFGSSAKQSALYLHDPHQLALGYTRAMLAPLLFNPAPTRVLLLGLGGGSLARFLLNQIADCHIDAVELRAAVVAVAHSHFHLPSDPRLNIIIEEAGSFIHGNGYRVYRDYDLILVDAFVDNGIARAVCAGEFFAECRERMTPTGWLSMNLWSGDYIRAADLLGFLSERFGHPALRLEVEGRENVIGLVTRGADPRKRLDTLSPRAAELQRQHPIEFPQLLKTLRRLNR